MISKSTLNRLGLTLLLLALVPSSPAGAATFDRYVGILRHAQAARDQVAKLDFTVDREADGELLLAAVLTLYFGGADSREYLSYHFKSVRYSLVTGRLVFDAPDQDVTIRSTNFGEGRLVAEVRSSLNGMVGTLDLTQDGSIVPERPIVKPLWGEYRGTCDGEDTYLQLSTFRRSEGAFDDGTAPFRSYEINGQLGRVDQDLCPNPLAQPCVTNQIHGGNYNFYRETLQLAGRQRNMSCTIGETGVTCDSCLLTRISAETAGPLQTAPVRAVNALLTSGADPDADPATAGPRDSLEGEYYGYLHHEALDVYQPTQLNIVSFQDQDANGSVLKLSASARLFFGDFGSQEALTYRFDAREFNIMTPQLVFTRQDADLDATLQVSTLGGGRARGVWFSRIYGRVGTFELVRGRPPSLPTGLKKMGLVSGIYTSPDLELQLLAQLGAGYPASENPFYPLELTGYLWYHNGMTARISISGGTYDFYTGRMSLRTVQENRVAVGSVDPVGGRLWLKLPSRVFGSLMPRHEPVEYGLMTANFAPAQERTAPASAQAMEAVYRYRLEHLPETAQSCPEAALRWADALSQSTGVRVIAQGCERPVGDERRGMNVVISYVADRPLAAGTTVQDIQYGGSDSADTCNAALAEDVRTFREQTGLDVFAAYCSPTGYLIIRAFGVSAIQRYHFDSGLSGAGLSDIHLENPDQLREEIVQALSQQGVAASKVRIRDRHLYVYYYGRTRLQFDVLGETAYLSEADCVGQQARVKQHLQAFWQTPLVQYCAPTSAFPTPKRALFTFVWARTNAAYGQVRTLYQDDVPSEYETLATCEAARPDIERQYRGQGYLVYSSWCTVPPGGERYVISIFRR